MWWIVVFAASILASSLKNDFMTLRTYFPTDGDSIAAYVTEDPISTPSWFTSTYNMVMDAYLKRDEDPFDFYINCKANETACKTIESGLKAAGRRIAKVLHFVNKVNIPVAVDDLCENSKLHCDSVSLLGKGAMFEAASNHTGEPFFLHPQALLKQVNMYTEPSFEEMDMSITFNSHFKFWAKDASQREINADEWDVELLSAREITSGLGFHTTFQSSLSGLGGNVTWHLRPGIEEKINSGTRLNDRYEWMPPSRYDKFLFIPSSNQSFLDLSKGFYKERAVEWSYIYNQERKRDDRVVNELLNNARAMYKALFDSVGIRVPSHDLDPTYRVIPSALKVSDSLSRKWKQFKIPRSPREIADEYVAQQSKNELFAWTPSELERDTLDYLSSDSEHTPNFLMVGDVTCFRGKSLQDLINLYSFEGQIKTFDLYGYEMMKIMTEIGWPTDLNPDRRNRFAHSIYSSPNPNDGLSIRLGWVTVLGLLVLMY